MEEAKRMTLTADGNGAVFDVPTTLAKARAAGCRGAGPRGCPAVRPGRRVPSR